MKSTRAVIQEVSSDGKRCIAFSEECLNDLNAFFEESRFKKKLRLFATRWLNGEGFTSDLFEKENPDGKCDNIYAFKPGKGKQNPRIYCQQVKTTQGYALVLVMGALIPKKKQQKLGPGEISAIQRVSKTQYKLINKDDREPDE